MVTGAAAEGMTSPRIVFGCSVIRTASSVLARELAVAKSCGRAEWQGVHMMVEVETRFERSRKGRRSGTVG